MDDRLHRDSHGSYESHRPLDYSRGSGSGGGALFIIFLLAAIVLGALFIGPSSDTESGTVGGASTETTTAAPATAD